MIGVPFIYCEYRYGVVEQEAVVSWVIYMSRLLEYKFLPHSVEELSLSGTGSCQPDVTAMKPSVDF